MNILLITEAASAGVGRHVIDLAQGLLQHDHRVHLLYSPVRSDATFRSDLAQLPGLSSIAALSMRHAPHPEDAFIIWEIRRLIHRHGPFDVVHLHSTKAGFLGRLAGIHHSAAIVYTPHAPLTMRPGLVPWAAACARSVERVLSSFTAAVIAVSSLEYDHLVSLGLDRKKLFLVPNGLRQTPLLLRKDWNAAPQQVVIGVVARLESQKRVDLLLNAVARLRPAARARVRLAIIGSGSESGPLRCLAGRLGIAPLVKWLGPVQCARERMPSFDLFALTSDYEGMPYTLLEAASAGLPIVTTHVGGAEDVVRHGWNGFITPSGDVPALAEALDALILDDELRRIMAARSAASRDVHSLSTMVEATIQVYDQTLLVHGLVRQRQGFPAAEPVARS